MTRYKDIVPSYEQYLRLQTESYRSFESEVPRWSDPQREAIRFWFAGMDRRSRILDGACGDGAGLGLFRSLGFTDVAGIELCPAKAERARSHGYAICEGDMHVLPYPDEDYGVAYSSHTLEHCYEPLRALRELHRVLYHGGDLFLILPYPDTGMLEAHGGKHELRTEHEDNLVGLTAVVENCGFTVRDHTRGYRDGPEVRLHAVKP